MKEYYVYILRCRDGTFYTGVTSDYEERVAQHQAGVFPGCYTYKRRPVKLVYLAEFCEVDEAIAWEKRVKRWSRRKKEALINGEYEKLSKLSLCENGTRHAFYTLIACHAERSRSATRALLCDLSLDYARDDTIIG